MKKVFILLISLIAMLAVCLNIKALEATNANTSMDGNAVRTQYSFIYDGNWNDGSNWDTGVVPDPGSDVVIMANVIIPSGYTAIANEVSLLGGSITVADGGQLRHNTPDLVVTMKKNIEPYSNENDWGNYYLLGFPFSENVAVPDAMTAAEGNDFYRFDPKCHDAEWRNNKEQAITIVGGTTGYLYANPEAIELSLTGSTYPSFNGEVMTVIVPYTQGSNNNFNGWRLMGNPFTCNAYIYCHNSDNEFFPMDFMVCDPSGELVTISGGPIAPMQGFFVKVTETTTVYIMNHAIPMGAIKGKFTINDMGNEISFSRGNLQYRASTNTWRFAERQWDCLRLENANVSSSYDGWIDLFGWGTSGYNHGAVCYQPWSTSTSGSDYYAYGSSEYNLYDQTSQADWGYNAISNGGNTENQWRTLTNEEWSYLLFTRETPSGTRFAKATVNNVEGLVVLPDDWDFIYYDLNETNNTSANYSANVIDENDWMNALETHGAVFLPAGSYRRGASNIEQNNPYKAYYWTSSNVKYFEFNNTQLFVSNRSRDNGLSVRLARSVESSSLPSVITTEVTDITQTTAACGGVVIDDGGATVTERGVCWSTNPTPTTSDNYAIDNTSMNSFTIQMNYLIPYTKYYVRAYAINCMGITYGNELSFVTVPSGAINGLFSVDTTQQVCFSRGNLQYRASTNTWRFAEHQWDCLRLENANVSSSYDGWIDLFGWGTSGYNHGAVCYQPWSTSTNGSDYYAYGSSGYNLYDQTGKADWGYNAISNGGNTENQWRTLRSEEWSYLLFTRETPSGTRFAKAKVNNVEGLVVLPDNWNPSYYYLSEANSASANYSANVIDENGWTNALEAHGAVFLPAGSYRRAASEIEQSNPFKAYYWTSSNVKYFEFNNNQLFVNNRSRDNGLSVRLARPVASSSLPSVITTEVTNITQTTAVCGGDVMDDGGATVTERGVCWSTSHNPTVGGSHASNGTGTGAYTVNMTNLTANTTYYVRAYAKNSAGTAYGEEQSFTTLQQPTYIVSVAVYPSYSGTVTGGGSYYQGHPCSVSATANAGYAFVNWTENGNQVSTNANYTFTVTGNRNLVANFAAVQQSYTISVSANPSNGGMVSGGGTYLRGHSCTVHATAATGYTFVRWTENGSQVSTNANYTFSVTDNRALVAQFQAESYSIMISANPTDGGTVAGGGDYNYGESCIVSATANDGYTFSNWTENGNVVSSTAYYTFTVAGNRTLVANFQPQQYTITTSVNPTNGGIVVGGGQYDYGQSCTLTANASNGYTFNHWTRNGTAISGGATISFTVAGNATYVAYFTFNGNHAYVDLGLPSGLLWATRNVGASSPEDYGYYFAWGETQPKSYYDWSTYQYCNGSDYTLTKYCNKSNFGYFGFTDNLTTLLPEDDAATANWGSGWRMPTDEEWQELLNYTTVSWTQQNGVNGRLFTASNGNSLFLPATGGRWYDGLGDAGSGGNYWSSSLYTPNPLNACCIYFDSIGTYVYDFDYRCIGRSVRAVRSSSQN